MSTQRQIPVVWFAHWCYRITFRDELFEPYEGVVNHRALILGRRLNFEAVLLDNGQVFVVAKGYGFGGTAWKRFSRLSMLLPVLSPHFPHGMPMVRIFNFVPWEVVSRTISALENGSIARLY